VTVFGNKLPDNTTGCARSDDSPVRANLESWSSTAEWKETGSDADIGPRLAPGTIRHLV